MRLSSFCMSLRSLQIQRAQRLVEQQHLGPVDQGAGDGHALLLAAGERGPTLRFSKPLRRDDLQHLRDALLDLASAAALAMRRPKATFS